MTCDTAGPAATARLRALAPGQHLTLIGLDAADLAAILLPDMPPLLRLDLAGTIAAEAAVARILDDLADLALAAWPDWPPCSLGPWRRAAGRLAATGRRPRFNHVPAQTQFSMLHPAAGAPRLLFRIDADRAERAAPLIAAMEWVCRQGGPAIALLPDMPPPGAPWDRVLYDALVLEPVPRPSAASRLYPPPARGSTVERRLRAALRADAELGPLFEDEVTVPLGPLGPAPRVDLLWRAGKVVVEIDGPEHARDPNYGADRHRDYELLVGGYLVLRLTNAEIERDLARAIDKIRRVAGLRRVSA